MKKKISLMVSVIMLLQILLPILTVIWESDFTIESVAEEATENEIVWTYTLLNGEAKEVEPKNRNSLPTEVIIPSELDGHKVTSIGSFAFYLCNSLTSITIPEGVTSIRSYAFYGCDSLTSITIPESVTSIGNCVFLYCDSLTSITVEPKNQNYSDDKGVLFNKNKTEIIQYPEGKTETEYIIPNSVTTIGSSAFYNFDSLTSITIPKGVTSIGEEAFSYCDSLTSIKVESDNQNYSDDNGVLFNKNKTEIIKYPEGKTETEYIIPSSVTKIGAYAFESCGNLTSITIPESVTSIGSSAFKGCNRLTSITIPESVTSIEDYAFKDCYSLTSITIPEGVTSIGYEAFAFCNNLTSITIPKGVTSIGDWAFYNCDSLTIYTWSGSKAEEYAKDNDVPYVLLPLNSIKISQAPTKTRYVVGENFDTKGMKVTATFNGGTSTEITDYIVTDGNNLTAGKTSVTISYTIDGVTKTTTQPITVTQASTERILTGITISKAPTKTSYIAGQDFDKAGMEVTATYNDGSSQKVTNYTIPDAHSLTVGKTSVTISYTEGGVTKTTTQPITVTQASTEKSVTKITLSKVPTKTKYIQSKEELDVTGGQIKVTYSDGTEETISITKGMVTGFDNTKVGKQILKISYGGKTTTYEVEIVADSNNNSGNNNTGDNNQNNNNSGNNNTGDNSQNSNNSGNSNSSNSNSNNNSGNNGNNNKNNSNSNSNNTNNSSQSGNSTNSGSVTKTGANTEAEDKLPYTGSGVIGVSIVLLTIISGISYVAYRRYRNI